MEEERVWTDKHIDAYTMEHFPTINQDEAFNQPILFLNWNLIMNAVLNNEIRRMGGRVLIRLGSQDIDFSPSFTMFLSTQDPSVKFSPDICSRVTFVNFMMTRSSLQSQSLDHVLKVERPDTDWKRTDLMKIQGEFCLHLRTLEKLLLEALKESQGNILDDDKVIDTLETLKREAAEITRKVKETDIIMKEVEEVTAEYLTIAQACSAVFVLEQLNLVNHFYQFLLHFFLDIFDYVLHHNLNLKTVTDYSQRRDILLNDLFLVVYNRTSRALLHHNRVMLAVLLGQVKLIATRGLCEELSLKPVETHLVEHEDEWRAFLESNTTELNVPMPWEPSTPAVEALRATLGIKCLRPD
ncbi:dynein heavy chain [Marasmius tenuissimus]|uniref:Dynein heavy chain n=1 Tax=Marasmius tenuissimus TaxID=585030 RepID=A0ABR2ZNM4_9AGAR